MTIETYLLSGSMFKARTTLCAVTRFLFIGGYSRFFLLSRFYNSLVPIGYWLFLQQISWICFVFFFLLSYFPTAIIPNQVLVTEYWCYFFFYVAFLTGYLYPLPPLRQYYHLYNKSCNNNSDLLITFSRIPYQIRNLSLFLISYLADVKSWWRLP